MAVDKFTADDASTGKHHHRTKEKKKGFYYFTNLTVVKAIFYAVAVAYVAAVSVVATLEPFLTLPCESEGDRVYDKYDNPAYVEDPCRRRRLRVLLGLTAEECSFGRRLVWAVVLGGIIGWERRQSDRPAGIRTMSLVSLGSALFTVNSAFAFAAGPNTWDASRISAAIPSGVGFLGAGMIFKEKEQVPGGEPGESAHVVHGLTTAASLWLSAAVGIACGGELYFAASFCTAIMLVLLRFGPRHNPGGEVDDESSTENDSEEEKDDLLPLGETKGNASFRSADMGRPADDAGKQDTELTRLLGYRHPGLESPGSHHRRRSPRVKKTTSQAQLASVV